MTSNARSAALEPRLEQLSDPRDVLGDIVRTDHDAPAPPTSATEVAALSLFERTLTRAHGAHGDAA